MYKIDYNILFQLTSLILDLHEFTKSWPLSFGT